MKRNRHELKLMKLMMTARITNLRRSEEEASKNNSMRFYMCAIVFY